MHSHSSMRGDVCLPVSPSISLSIKHVLREPEEAKSCSIQGESVCPSIHMCVHLSPLQRPVRGWPRPLRATPPSSGPASKRLESASERPGSAPEGPQGGGTDGRTYIRMDGRTHRFPLYSTGLRLLRFHPELLPCSHNCYHYKIPEQGKDTNDHFLPLGDWFLPQG